MEAEDPLKDLADIHMPAAVSFWPPAPGWWAVALLVLALAAMVAFYCFKQWQQKQRLKVALAQLTAAHQQWQQCAAGDRAKQAISFLHTCNDVLKRVALVHYPAAQVAALSGRSWLEFLQKSGGSQDFTQGSAATLADAAYRRSWEGDENSLTAVHNTCLQWIEMQYVKQAPKFLPMFKFNKGQRHD